MAAKRGKKTQQPAELPGRAPELWGGLLNIVNNTTGGGRKRERGLTRAKHDQGFGRFRFLLAAGLAGFGEAGADLACA